MRVLLVLLFLSPLVFAKRYEKCALARELLRLGFPRNELQDWICLINAESGMNTAAKGGPNKDKSYDWGLWQINDRYWCKVGKRGGDCNIDCRNLVNDNIGDDAACAKKIKARHGFSAWFGWQNKCRGGSKPPSIKDCKL